MINNLLFSVVEVSNKLVETLSSSLGIWYIIILNAFGVIAILFKVSEFQLKSRKVIFLFASCAALCWVLYFLVQGDFVSALINLINMASIIIFSKREKYKWASSKYLFIAIASLQLTLGILTFKNWHDSFAIIGGVFATLCYFVASKKTYRILSAFNMSSWVLNSISKMYIIALINDSFALISVIVSIFRFYVFKKGDDEKEIESSKSNEIEQAKE